MRRAQPSTTTLWSTRRSRMTDSTGPANPAPHSPPLGDRGAGNAAPARRQPETRAVQPAVAPGRAAAPAEAPHEAPARPPLANPNAPPVLVKLTPPFSVRLCQFLWILSFAGGGFTTVYFFVIRAELLPLMADRAREVTPDRADATYEAAADIVFWVVFAIIVGTLLVQITLLVSFMGR